MPKPGIRRKEITAPSQSSSSNHYAVTPPYLISSLSPSPSMSHFSGPADSASYMFLDFGPVLSCLLSFATALLWPPHLRSWTAAGTHSDLFASSSVLLPSTLPAALWTVCSFAKSHSLAFRFSQRLFWSWPMSSKIACQLLC